MATTPPLRRILYVEDEPDIQVIARFALEKVGGFETKVCGSGEEALAALAGFSPDLILLDVMLPKMDGPSILAELRRRPATAGIPVLFLTARVSEAELKRYRELGAAEVLLKPFDPMTLPATLRQIWEGMHGQE